MDDPKESLPDALPIAPPVLDYQNKQAIAESISGRLPNGQQIRFPRCCATCLSEDDLSGTNGDVFLSGRYRIPLCQRCRRISQQLLYTSWFLIFSVIPVMLLVFSSVPPQDGWMGLVAMVVMMVLATIPVVLFEIRRPWRFGKFNHQMDYGLIEFRNRQYHWMFQDLNGRSFDLNNTSDPPRPTVF